MADDGVPPDAQSGDKIYTRSVTFPDATPFNVGYKYWSSTWPNNGGFECEGLGDRSFVLDDVANSTGTPLVLALDGWNGCGLVGIPGRGTDPLEIPGFALLSQNAPNPAGALTTIRFVLKQAGHVVLNIYDISGRHVAKLLEANMEAGPHLATWNGRDPGGQLARSGVYVYELAMGGERLARRMVITR
jgi:hypothetical protein